jgi:phosphopantothenoylcysteine decarboxylase/phosphopantothenate--cysteine ligase
MSELTDLDLLIMAAAPADYRPAAVSDSKIKKSAERLTLELVRTEDILAAVAKAKSDGQGIVGFALETENELENAKRKLAEKDLDLIVANNPTLEGAGFGTETNVVTIVGRSGVEESLDRLPKTELADVILTRALAELGWDRDGDG